MRAGAQARIIRGVAEAIYRSRADLQSEFAAVDDPDFWHWLMWHGSLEHPELARILYPYPPQELSERVAGGGITPDGFLHGALVDRRRLYLCLREGGYDFRRPGRVLDFGCGCARTLRFFCDAADTTTFVGCDIDRQAVAWAQTHIDFPDFVVVGSRPALPFLDGAFDAIMAFSVFTHLPENLQRRYLRELRRIAAPGAVIVISTHGEEAMRLYADGQRPGLHPPADVVAAQTGVMKQHGFSFIPYPGATPDRPYGTAFLGESYIRQRWGELFTVVAFHAAPDGWQDFTVLRS